MGKIRVEIPSSMSDLPLCRFKAVRKALNDDLLESERVVRIVAAASGQSFSNIKATNYKQVLKACKHVLEVIAKYKKSSIKKEVKINGMTYVFAGDTSKWNAAQWVDANMYRDTWQTDLHKTAAILYIEKGFMYGQENEKGETIHPMSKRAEMFDKHFPSDLYLDIEAFFLSKLNRQQGVFLKGKRVNAQRLVENMQKILTSQVLTS